MPRGVTDQFLEILDNERRASVKTAIAMGVLVPVAYFMAELTDEPLAGRVVLLAGAALVAGVALGGFVAWRRTRGYNESLRGAWNQWMRMSLSCSRIDDLARQVAHKGRRWPVGGVAWGALFLANAAAFVALWVESSAGVAAGAGVTAANGLVLGGLLGYAAWSFRWAGQFHHALDELMTEGQLGVWGEH